MTAVRAHLHPQVFKISQKDNKCKTRKQLITTLHQAKEQMSTLKLSEGYTFMNTAHPFWYREVYRVKGRGRSVRG